LAKSEEDVVQELMAMNEGDRDRYCVEVVNALADAFEGIMKMDSKIKQARAVKALMADLRDKKSEILPVVFYMIKPQFRDTIAGFMEKFAGYAEKEIGK
jgi:hypothetical protein